MSYGRANTPGRCCFRLVFSPIRQWGLSIIGTTEGFSRIGQPSPSELAPLDLFAEFARNCKYPLC